MLICVGRAGTSVSGMSGGNVDISPRPLRRHLFEPEPPPPSPSSSAASALHSPAPPSRPRRRQPCLENPSSMSSMHLPALHMSNIIAADAPLTSPIADALAVPWDRDPALAALYDPFSLPMSTSPPSSHMPGAMPDTRKVLKGRMTPDVPSDQCLPTHQVFDFVPGTMSAQMSSPASTPASSPQVTPQNLPRTSAAGQHTFPAAEGSSDSGSSAGSVVVPAKRPPVTINAGACTKKARSGERVSTKDFVPPDVTGLSKREARLVKNRAAAFLSRQRKREEFEHMEM